MRVYLSFVDSDATFARKLEVHLAPMRQSGKISLWHRGKAAVDTKVSEVAIKELEHADLVVVLISAEYNADDDHVAEVKLARSLGKRVLPILAEAAPLTETLFEGTVVLPRDGKPLAGRKDLDAALVGIVEEIRKVVIVKPQPEQRHAPAPGARSILDEVPYPWQRKQGQDLWNTLIDAYQEPDRVVILARQAGASMRGIHLQQAIDKVWYELIDASAKATTLVGLVTRALKDQDILGFHPRIREAIAPKTLP